MSTDLRRALRRFPPGLARQDTIVCGAGAEQINFPDPELALINLSSG